MRGRLLNRRRGDTRRSARSACRPHFRHLRSVDEIPCAVNRTGTPCTRRDQHLTTCQHPTDGTCTGCAPRPAVHGYLCRGHYERWERAFTTLDRLRGLLLTIGNGRAVQATSSASTTAGPRVPLSALRLDLDALDRAPRGNVEHPDGVLDEWGWVRAVEATARRHPTEPKPEKLHRVRCASCRQVAVVLEAPTTYLGDQILRCKRCGWTSADQDYAEAAAMTSALERNPYERRRHDRNAQARLAAMRLVEALR